ncbi:shikimate dehydrogenase [Microbacterium sp.]|uniref:shikimate dehydrogenase family protein n=1 Tax=Microbacterium sp. TaxID=51671 RepID=UPI0025F38C91|nr:shikimate dehydrogenase [Microbacterium sp.]
MIRLEVWGDPIDHSLSPVLHRAAYAQLGWEWRYDRRRVDAAGFRTMLNDVQLRGASITFPLKNLAWAAAATRDRRAELTGAVNTLLLDAALTGGDGPYGFNTDVGGIVRDLHAHGISDADAARLIGAGATATSALVALGELGIEHVDVLARRPDAAEPLRALGARLGMTVTVAPLEAPSHPSRPLTISTLPGGTVLPDSVSDAVAAGGGVLYDVVYGQWPTALAAAWERMGGRAVNGLGMLLHQAVLQIRIFATGDPDEPLPDEPSVVAVMRRALVKD